jgi:two-component system, NtrC family, sensor kinase
LRQARHGIIGFTMGSPQQETIPANLAGDATVGRPKLPSPLAPLAEATRGFRQLWAAAVLIPLVVLAAASFWSLRDIEGQAHTRVMRTVDMLHEHALRSLETKEAILEAIDRRIEGMPWEEISGSRTIHEFLAALDRRSQPSGGIVLVAPDRRIVAGSARFPFMPIDASDRDYTQDFAHEATGTFIGETIASRPTGTRVFPVSRPRGLDDVSSGWVVGSFRPGYFEDFYRSVVEDEHDVVSLVRADGKVLASTAGTSRSDLHAPPSTVTRVLRGRPMAGIVEARSEIDGIDRLVAYRVVSGYPLYVAYGLNRSVIRDHWLREVMIYALICAVAAGLLLGFTARVQQSVRREQRALAEARQEAEKRADAEARLLHAQKVDALGQIVGGVAHDFNNIVQAVKGGASRISRRAEEPEEVRRVAGMVETTAERGARLIARMLAFARREQSRSELFVPGEALTEIGELLRETIGSGYRIALDIPAATPPVAADRSEFETAIVNLVLNARDAMPGGGEVRVSARIEEAPKEAATEETAEIADAAPARIFVATVSDSGTGMDEATLARAGEPFFTTKGPGKGTGLGLATARAFVEQAGGELVIESVLGKGTSIALRLPIYEPVFAHDHT